MATICVFCASSDAIDPTYLALATSVGGEMARRGYDLVTGGGAVSMMGAVSRAVRIGGQRTVGVIPHALLALEVADGDADELVVTPDMRTRKAEMDRRADAFLALPGGIGTLEELVEVWVAATLGMHAKPVVVLDPDGMFAPLRAQADLMASRGFVRQSAVDALRWASTPAEALDTIEALWAQGNPPMTPTVDEVLEGDP